MKTIKLTQPEKQSKYPLVEWVAKAKKLKAGEGLLLTKGVDFTCKPLMMAQTLWEYRRENGCDLHCRVVENGVILWF